MAKIGLDNFLYAILTEAPDGTPSYGTAKKPARAIEAKVDVSSNDVKLYADNAIAESDTSFQGGSVTLGIDHEDIEVMADLLGHTVTDGEMVRNMNDVAPYVGFARIAQLVLNGVPKFRVEFLFKVKFAEPSQENKTRGESVEFGTYELSGVVATLANGDWSKAKTFDTKADAAEYANALFS